MAPEPLDQVRPAHDDACLRAPEKLVAGEADEVGARCETCTRGRLVPDLDERARAKIVDERQSMAARQLGEVFEARLLGEPDDAEVRLVDA